MNPPTWATLGRYWRAPAADLYMPITWTAWSLIAHAAYLPIADANGVHLNPYLFHLANLAIHMAAAVLVFEILRKLFPRAAMLAPLAGALLFALHPLQVEPVSWVSGLKDVLCGALSLAAILCWISDDNDDEKRRIHFVLATIFLVAALLAKPAAIVVPLIVLLIDVAFRGRDLRRSFIKLWPWFVIAVLFALRARMAQPAPQIASQIAWWRRPAIAIDALTFDLGKLVWPLRLGVDYGRTPKKILAAETARWAWIAPLTLLAIGLMLRRLHRAAGKIVLACFALFVLAVLPVLGLVPFDFQVYSTVADHYLYLALLVPAIGAAWLIAQRPRTLAAPAALILVALSILSFRQATTWHDATAIASQTLAVNPHSFAWRDRLAKLDLRGGDLNGALEEANRTVASEPRFAIAWITRGTVLSLLARPGEARISFERALALEPDNYSARAGLANTLADLGQPSEAIIAFRAALAIKPDDVETLTNFAAVLASQGELPAAIAAYEKALAIDPTYTDAVTGLARARAAAEGRSPVIRQ